MIQPIRSASPQTQYFPNSQPTSLLLSPSYFQQTPHDTLKQVSHRLVRRIRSLIRIFLLEHFKVSLQSLAQLQNGRQISRSVAVIRSGPHLRVTPHLLAYRAHRLIEEVLVSVHGHLMRSAHQLQPVDLVELLCHVRAEDPARSAEIALESRVEGGEAECTLRCRARDRTRADRRRGLRWRLLGSGRCC